MVVRHLKVHFERLKKRQNGGVCVVRVLRAAGFVRARHARPRIVR